MIYIAMQNADRTQGAFFQKTEDTMSNRAYTHDVDGNLMNVLFELEADSWNEAMTLYHERMGYEPYIPMEDPVVVVPAGETRNPPAPKV